MKAIMISIKPEWVCKILNGEKTIEIRKTKPSCDLPVKVYIYCTKNNGKGIGKYPFYQFCDDRLNHLNGKVVAEWHLKEIIAFDRLGLTLNDMLNVVLEKSCLTHKQLQDYLRKKNNKSNIGEGYAWHIEDLHIYDQPKELSEFGVKRAFQSWGYVEEIENE